MAEEECIFEVGVEIMRCFFYTVLLKFGPERSGMLAAQLDSQPSPALATHFVCKKACSRGASGE